MLRPEEYFARYGEHLADPDNPKPYLAWLRTEADFRTLYPPFYRFKNYDSFRQAHRRYRQGERPTQIILQMEICLL